MYDSRDFSAMPILADAAPGRRVRNAADVLGHCRGPAASLRPQVLEVVDLVLGKRVERMGKAEWVRSALGGVVSSRRRPCPSLEQLPCKLSSRTRTRARTTSRSVMLAAVLVLLFLLVANVLVGRVGAAATHDTRVPARLCPGRGSITLSLFPRSGLARSCSHFSADNSAHTIANGPAAPLELSPPATTHSCCPGPKIPMPIRATSHFTCAKSLRAAQAWRESC